MNRQGSFFDLLKPRAPPTLGPVGAPLLHHPIWARLRGYVRISRFPTGRKRPHIRIEVATAIPAGLRAEALEVRVPCARCGELMYPIRRRAAEVERSDAVGQLFVSVTCPLELSMGCARGKAARRATGLIEADLMSLATETNR